MLGFLSSRSPPTGEPSASALAPPQTAKTRSPLVRAAHKLKKIVTGVRSKNNVSITKPSEIYHEESTQGQPQWKFKPIRSTPSTHPPPSHITGSAKVSEPLIPHPINGTSSSRSAVVPSSSIPPPGNPSSDSWNFDQALRTRQTPLTAEQRPSSWDRTSEAGMSPVRYSAGSQKIHKLNKIPTETARQLFLGEVGSVCSSTEPSPPRGPVTTEELEMLETQRRDRAYRYAYLQYTVWLTPEQRTQRDLTRRARARRSAYLNLVGELTPGQLAKRNFERRGRAYAYRYLPRGGLNPAGLVERDDERRERAHLEAYMKLNGELQYVHRSLPRGGLNPAEFVDLYDKRRERAHLEAYMKLNGELQ